MDSRRPPSRTSVQKENVPASKSKLYPPLLSKGAPPTKAPTNFYSMSDNNPRKPFTDTKNRDLRSILSDELASLPSTTSFGALRRVMSAPHPDIDPVSCPGPQRTGVPPRVSSMPTTPPLTADSGLGSLPSGTLYDANNCCPESEKGEVVFLRHPLLAIPGTYSYGDLAKYKDAAFISKQSGQRGRSHSIASAAPTRRLSAVSLADKAVATSRPSSAQETSRNRQSSLSPVRSSVPKEIPGLSALSTAYLAPKTHKVAAGQLVVLPSKSLLIDFREGERRKGQKGIEVLMTSPDGQMVHVYSAPHLSTPCCLAEPLATYPMRELPAQYRKLYGDAGRVVDHLKQRIPKLVLHKPEYKCTLMANEPLGDIEVVFTPEVLGVAGSYSKGGTSIPQGPNLRVRLSRLRQSAEISRHVPPASEGRPGTGEWVKKVLPVTPGEYALLGEALEKLESTEKTGWRHLVDFLMICQAVEELETKSEQRAGDVHVGPSLIPPLELAAVPDNSGDDRGRQGGRQRLKDVLKRQEDANAVPRPPGSVNVKDSADDNETLLTVATTASTNVLRSMELPPRPSKFSSGSARNTGGRRVVSENDSKTVAGLDYVSGSDSWATYGRLARRSAQTALDNVADHSRTPQTRFIPSDGAALEVEVASNVQDAVQFSSSVAEQSMMMSLEAAETRIPERMKALVAFIRLFDDG